jgi:hypothetical protein
MRNVVAYHEAGHVIVARGLGVLVFYVDLNRAKSWEAFVENGSESPHQQSIIAYGGIVGEVYGLGGRMPYLNPFDARDARTCKDEECGPSVDARLVTHQSIAASIVRAHVQSLHKLARELKRRRTGRMTGQDIEEFLRAPQ